VLYLLDSSLDNVKLFYKELSKIGKLIGVTFDRLVEPKKDKEFPDLETISKYRDTLLHNPVLARAAVEDIEKIATREKLNDIKHSWFESEKLTDNDLIDARKLLEELRLSYGRYLNGKWEKILFRLDSKRENYLRRMNLETLTLTYDEFMPTTYAGPGPSGSIDCNSARSNVVQPPNIKKL
jgi:hypothetical protein